MKQVAVGIIIKDGRVLACQRKRTTAYPLKWEFPGGKLEKSESPEAALVRELREELSIEATVGREFHRQEWMYDEASSDARKNGAFRVFYFLVREFNGVMVNHVFEQIRWVNPQELEAMDILEGNRAAVQLLLKHEQATFVKLPS